MQSVHLVILIHGLYGSTLNLSAVEEELLALATSSSSHEEPRTSTSSAGTSFVVPGGSRSGAKGRGDGVETVVYLPKGIKGARTWDGVDVCAHRISEEIDRETERLQDEGKDVVGFSVMGYSLGGLIARYLIGLLDARQPSFFARHKPVSFSTSATPHLGVLKYGTLTNTVVHTVGRQLFSRTGRQIYCLDKEADWGGRGLLEIMADPDHIFIQALKRFPKIMIVANGCQDLTVPYPTASISLTDPFGNPSTLDVDVDENHIVQSYRHVYSRGPEDLPVNHSTELDSDGEEVEVKITVIKPAAVRGAEGKRRLPLPPPYMMLPWPLSYIVFAITPLLMPFLLVYLAVTIAIHNAYSRRRIRSHRDTIERQPLLVPSTTSLTQRRSIESYDAGSSSPRTMHVDVDVDGISTPPLSEPVNHSGASLHLTPAQKLMIRNLNGAIPRAERVVAWFPWAYNSHAMLVCRDSKRFPWTADGRGVVRRWTSFVYDAGLEVLHMARGEGVEIHGRT